MNIQHDSLKTDGSTLLRSTMMHEVTYRFSQSHATFKNEVVIKVDKSWGNVPFVNVIDILQLGLILIFCFKILLTLNHCKQKKASKLLICIQSVQICIPFQIVKIFFPNLIYSIPKLMSVCPEDGFRKRMFANIPEPIPLC